MSTQEIIEEKISYIEKRLSVAKKYQHYSKETIEKDEMIRSVVERELYVLAQAVIDLAEAVVALKKLRKPTTMREAFDILGEADILPKEFLGDFSKIVGFRNSLAHDYRDLQIEVIYDVLQVKLDQVEEFINYIEQNLEL